MLDEFINSAKANGSSLIGCIRLVSEHFKLKISESTELVLNSPAWIEHQADFIAQQQELWEEIGKLVDEVEINDDGTTSYLFDLKKGKET
ncbi:MAG: hypothetical protein AAF433_17525 [Bacteroidota bacterium]